MLGSWIQASDLRDIQPRESSREMDPGVGGPGGPFRARAILAPTHLTWRGTIVHFTSIKTNTPKLLDIGIYREFF